MKPYFIQTDTSGNETWRLVYSQHMGSQYVGDAWVSLRDIHGNYFSAGRSYNSPALLRFSGSGYEMTDIDLFPTAVGGGSRSLVMLNDTNIYIGAGWTFNGSTNYLGIVKTDTLGSIKTIKYFPDPDHSGINWTSATFDKKLVTIGNSYIGSNSRMTLYKLNSNLEYDSTYTNSFTYDSLCPDTIVSHKINPNCDILVGVDGPFAKAETTTLKIFPNPACQKITVELPRYIVVKSVQSGFGSTTVYHHWKSAQLEVYDLSGGLILRKEVFQSQPSMDIDVSAWPRGMYNFKLAYKDQIAANEKVLVRK